MKRMHRHWVLGSVIAILFVAGSVTPQGQAQIVTIVTYLDGGQEVPPVVTGAHGKLTFTVDRGTGRATYRMDVFGLSAGVTQSHIHVGCANVAGPTIWNIPVRAGEFPTFSLSGTLTAADFIAPRAAQGVTTLDQLIVAIMAGTTYVNVHTTTNPGGEIRGHLRVATPNDNPANRILVPCLPG